MMTRDEHAYQAARPSPKGGPTPVNEFRQVYLNASTGEDHGLFCSNVVITSKYTVWSFLPKFLFESFKKLANAYFLFVSALQCVPAISNTNGWPTSLPVLVFILAVDGVLAIIEDRRRHLADEEANSAKCRIVKKDGSLDTILWANLTVGSIVKLSNRDTAPADLLILAVHENDPANKAGICYVETKSLDGETNLKLRQAMESTLSVQTEAETLALHGYVECEQPNKAISRFSGTLMVDGQEKTPISIKNILLRGCQLRNTEWMYGLVLNTGPDTKIMQSASKPVTKWSSINDQVNIMIKWLLLLLFALCAIAATTHFFWEQNFDKFNCTIINDSTCYIPSDSYTGFSRWLVACGGYFLLMYQMIPVSLYVTISTVMFLQAIFMSMDIDVYYAALDVRMIVRTMGLNEELGQISYVFSDKTGTLTCNVMEFRKCSINGVSYGLGTTEIGRAALKRKGIAVAEPTSTGKAANQIPYVNFEDPRLLTRLNTIPLNGNSERSKEAEFFLHLAICHTVIPEEYTNKDGDVALRYSASSPDEQALVSAAKYFGFTFESRGLGVARIRITNKALLHAKGESELWEFQVCDVLEFNSDRKRMSCVVRDPSGEYMLLTKGADNVIQPLLSESLNDHDMVMATFSQLESFADDGLRTLTIARKTISKEEYMKWSTLYRAACASLSEIEKRKRGEPNEIDRLMEDIEKDLVLLGATAIEDKLQDNVPRAIARLMEAGMKVWVLTGDKQETAINIAYACQLMDNDMEQYIFNMDECPDVEALRSRLAECLLSVEQHPDVRRSLVIDGDALEIVMQNQEACVLFLKVALQCASVVCCRVSPSQKAEIVGLVRNNNPKARTLAIGDGANDVAMIQRAHIGVGICGQEGMQAVNSSDYAIGQFYFLEKLLLHHGRLNYIRMSKLVGYMFYKNIVMVLAQYYYLFTTGSSGQKAYAEIAFQLYNMAFTSLPIIVLGVFDYDVPWHIGQQFPALYRVGLNGELFNTVVFFKWICASVYESAVIFIFAMYGYNQLHYGTGSGEIHQYGIVLFALVVFVCNLKIIPMQMSWTVAGGTLWFLGVLSYIPVTIYIESIWFWLSPGDYGTTQNTLNGSTFWLVIPSACVMCLLRHFSWMAFQRYFYPFLWQVVQERFVLGMIPKSGGQQSSPTEMETGDYEAMNDKNSTVQSFPIRHMQEGIVDANYEERLHRQSSRYSSGSRQSYSSSKSFSRRNSGFAFSQDPQSSAAESIMVTKHGGSTAAAILAAESRTRVTRADQRNADFSTSSNSQDYPELRVVDVINSLFLAMGDADDRRNLTADGPVPAKEYRRVKTPSVAVVASTEGEIRQVHLNDMEQNRTLYSACSNVVVTSKYTIISFLPKFLFESFCKVANLFFLVVCILQTIKSISNTYGVPTNAPTLFFVICIDAIFAIMEDRRRHASDNAANSAICHVMVENTITNRLWSEVQVGDILQIKNREVIPADVLILSVAEPDPAVPSGICYVETKSLDGETNLKLRQALPATMGVMREISDIDKIKGCVSCETPNPFINKFAGNIDVWVAGQSFPNEPLSIKNVLLRGCTLRNTDWVYGLVLNTGSDTKIMQSASSPPNKWSDVMLTLNKMIGILCLGLLVLCSIAATVFVTWQNEIAKEAWYLNGTNPADNVVIETTGDAVGAWFTMLFYYFLLLYQVIPISLYVSLTTVKFLQSSFMAWDIEMYHAETDTPAIVRTMALNEELGQISYIFSDKTGTLTCNVMDFRKCSINGVSYGSGLTEIGRAALKRAGRPIPPEPKPQPGAKQIPYVNFVDPSLVEAMEGKHGPEQQERTHRFFEHLAVCHTVIPEQLESGEIRLSASSPDEQALVAGAQYMGYKFESRAVGKAILDACGAKKTYEVLEVLEFNSTRKRMSVITRLPSGELYLYTKGADMMIYQRLCPASKALEEITSQHMEQYADDGLRTLAIAMKRLDEQFFADWAGKFRQASGSIAELEKRKNGQPNAIDNLMEEMESNLELIGATAIEDKLQSGVPECLSVLSQAKIKVWMLTGDKEETAINIGYACALLDNSIHQTIINMDNCSTSELIRNKLRTAADEYHAKGAKESYALIIDGEALEVALKPHTKADLIGLAQYCVAVICCRVSPAQKADMVRLIRENIPEARTLAIGDGANDVAMIQAAHVGIGISGQEGMQAVNSSDYAIAQFRFLKRLLLVHGRWNYLRISKVVVYMFYKNITLVLAQYWYGFLSGASGSKVYWEIGVQVYNIFFTGLPIVVLGVLDQDLPEDMSLKYPALYTVGPNRQLFNYYTFFRWLCAALYESMVIFLVMVYGYNTSTNTVGSESRVEYGIVAFTLAVLIVNLKITLVMCNWTWVPRLTWWGSVLSWFLIAFLCLTIFHFFVQLKVSYDEFGAFVPTFLSGSYWMILVIGCILALGRHFAWNQYQRLFNPELFQILQEAVMIDKKKAQRITITHIEDQPRPDLSMTLEDITPEERSRFNIQDDTISSTLPHRPSRHPRTNLRRTNTGYAFSCDEETTLVESFIATNHTHRQEPSDQPRRSMSINNI
ncbi:phospholipid-transporting ATPase [Thraustotheca clavata]|uniref:P-type phospholipid transporter n=1 Tax=Thraustotheca clavata TaxID=74557 RepID=A0A1V9ZVV3_9STRA|nr:phospholipid-transporting ATPase [Thraustotheca clavata]